MNEIKIFSKNNLIEYLTKKTNVSKIDLFFMIANRCKKENSTFSNEYRFSINDVNVVLKVLYNDEKKGFFLVEDKEEGVLWNMSDSIEGCMDYLFDKNIFKTIGGTIEEQEDE